MMAQKPSWAFGLETLFVFRSERVFAKSVSNLSAFGTEIGRNRKAGGNVGKGDFAEC